MSNAVTFTSRTSRFGLPFLFAGQAQKEFYINEAYALVDALLQPVVEGIANTPPIPPTEGACWLIDTNATDVWTGHETEIACYQAGSWLFAPAVEGMRVFDRSSGTYIQFLGGWSGPATIAPPTGGSMVDAEARASVAALIQALAGTGVIVQG